MAQTENEIVQGIGSDYLTKYGFHNGDEAKDYFFKSGRGLSHELVEAIAEHKNEPDWMRKFRHKSLDYFLARPLPTWGGDVSGIDFDNIYYYIKPTEKQAESWEDLPADIKDTWDKLGIPEAEKKYLAGVGAQYESEVVYHKLQQKLTDQGVLFLDMDSGLREHEELVKEYFGTIIPQNDNKFAALNSAVWSGGSFIYVPPGVHIDMPLQAYFRINAENMGQFERTLILVDEGAYVHYVEGCTAPIYSSDSLHSAVVEIVVKKGGRCRYTTIQNWSNNVYNLVTKRAVAYEDATMEWVDGNLGSKLTMKYPAIWLMGERAHGEVLSIAFAGKGQHQDAGGKCVHVAPEHDLGDHLEVDLEGRRPRRLPRPAGGREGRDEREVEGRLRRADPRRGVALGHLPVHPDRRERGRHRPRGDRLEDRRGAALLPHVARPLGGRGERDDRVGLRRADHEGAAARVRGRDEPADPAADGRLRRLAPTARWPSLATLGAARRGLPVPTDRRSLAVHGPARLRPGGVRRRRGDAGGESERRCSISTSPASAEVTEAGIEIVGAPEGVTFEPLDESHPRSDSLVGWNEKFAAHNAAVWTHGLLVHVPKGVVLEKPLYVRIANTVDGGSLFWRLLVVAEEGSRFTLIEEYVSARADLTDTRTLWSSSSSSRRPSSSTSRSRTSRARRGISQLTTRASSATPSSTGSQAASARRRARSGSRTT